MSIQDEEISTDAAAFSPSERQTLSPASTTPQPKSPFSPALSLSSLVPSKHTGMHVTFTNPGFPFKEYI